MSDATTESIHIEVAYALPEHQTIVEARVPQGATVEDGIRASGILKLFPDIDLEQQKVGIFSKVVPLTQSLAERDRIEIYRKLIADPKAARRNRAEQDKAKKKGESDAEKAGADTAE